LLHPAVNFGKMGDARGDALALNERQYEKVWDLLELDDDDLAELGGLSAPDEKFCLLWKHLPLADTTIARLLELERQQVMNRRLLAMRELARALGDAGQKPFSGTR
jgi:hypothetical protein